MNSVIDVIFLYNKWHKRVDWNIKFILWWTTEFWLVHKLVKFDFIHIFFRYSLESMKTPRTAARLPTSSGITLHILVMTWQHSRTTSQEWRRTRHRSTTSQVNWWNHQQVSHWILVRRYEQHQIVMKIILMWPRLLGIHIFDCLFKLYSKQTKWCTFLHFYNIALYFRFVMWYM